MRWGIVDEPGTADKMWSTGFYVCIALIVVSPFCVTYQFLDLKNIFDVMISFIVVVTIFNAVINTTSLIKLLAFNKNQRRSSEVHLFFMSLVQFIMELFVGLIMVLLRLSANDSNRQSLVAKLGQTFVPFGCDALTL
ncbi:hypothetical protein TELCIR_05265, partial [Teladorsagia circumcincta]